MASLPPRRLPWHLFRVESNCAEKNILAHFQRIRFGGGFGAAVLVGRLFDHSDRLCELVGGLPQRLVLSGFRRLAHLSKAGPESIVSLHNLPAFLPGSYERCKKRDAHGQDEDQN